jgi:hypothetical protein
MTAVPKANVASHQQQIIRKVPITTTTSGVTMPPKVKKVTIPPMAVRKTSATAITKGGVKIPAAVLGGGLKTTQQLVNLNSFQVTFEIAATHKF